MCAKLRRFGACLAKSTQSAFNYDREVEEIQTFTLGEVLWGADGTMLEFQKVYFFPVQFCVFYFFQGQATWRVERGNEIIFAIILITATPCLSSAV